jgi:hypothetical protein
VRRPKTAKVATAIAVGDPQIERFGRQLGFVFIPIRFVSQRLREVFHRRSSVSPDANAAGEIESSPAFQRRSRAPSPILREVLERMPCGQWRWRPALEEEAQYQIHKIEFWEKREVCDRLLWHARLIDLLLKELLARQSREGRPATQKSRIRRGAA